MAKISSVQFVEAVTIGNKPTNRVTGVLVTEDAIGIVVAGVRVPWSNVKFVVYEAETRAGK